MKGSEITLRATLEQVERTTGIPEPELDVPDLPSYAAHVWQWFWQLSRGRTCGMAMNPITWEAIDAWANRTGNNPRQWELDAITGIDAAFMVSMAPETPPKGKEK